MSAPNSKRWTVLELLNTTVEFFESRHIESARVNAEYLLASLYNLKRIELYARFNQPMTEDEVAAFRDMVRRRAKGEPLQYILGDVSFYGHKIKVDSRVLIPRPETELLVEEVTRALGPEGSEQEFTIADIGTGSGAIAITLAQSYPNAKIYACDVSVDALTLADENIKAHGLDSRVKPLRSDVFSRFKGRPGIFDAVVSNPPYVSASEMTTLSAEVKNEPVLALEAGKEGLDVIRVLVRDAAEYLKSGALLAFEFGASQGSAVKALLESSGMYGNIRIIKDLNGLDRMALAQKN